MRKLSLCLAILALAFCTVSSCKKNGEPNAPVGEIAISKLRIKINEPDSMLLVGADSTKTVTWVVNPAGFDTLRTVKNAARIKFTKAGNYTISAKNNNITSKSIVITVIDSVYAPPVYFIPFDKGEQITFVPQYVKSATSDSAYLAFTVSTQKKYCTNFMFTYSIYMPYPLHDKYYINFIGASIKSFDNTACTGTAVLTGHYNYASYQPVLKEGTYGFYAGFGQDIDHDYVGSMEVTATQIIFHWDDSTGIIISPKVLAR
ncbi:hypothetical protein [Mucilaginibacter sp. OK283]|jgi:hypothetical protein|uniref:hypothetical protein n=1 Tax=Mucilaginibacter sp. OK283 TaxID=1881049 RepID=UPI0008D1F586|nr:hypothetical protein [Mucilaginibacter sp. OK283]SEO60269.1 hypothetical protein SAMN05428947_10389 [Mucilaginibacter sp. OK283]